MIQTTYNAATVFVLNDVPDWTNAPQLRVTLPAQKERGLTGREARKPLGETLRCELDWTAILDQAALNLLRDSLQALGDETILCPAWPFALPGADWASAEISGGLLIGWLDDWSDFEIGTSLADPTDWDWVAPLLWGRLAQTPDPGLIGAKYGRVNFSFKEDSDALYALALDAVTFTNGPALADASVPKVFPFSIEWSGAPKSGGAEVLVERTQLGGGRQRAASYFPQSAERLQQGAVLLNGYSEIAELLRWFQDRRACVQAHYVRTEIIVNALAAQSNSGTNTITLEDADALGINRFVELTDGLTSEIVRITGIAGEVCTLSANLAHTWAAGTDVRLAMLARHAREELTLEFTSPELARVSLTWRELPAEYTVGSGETRGTTLGATNTKAFLYLVTLDWNGATEVHRFTGYERDLTASAQTWTARPVEHGEIRQSLALDRDELTLKARWWSGCPFRKFLPNALDCKVSLKIYECDVSAGNGTNVAQIFGGEITSAPMDGPIISATCAGANALFDRKFPRLLLQRRCNHALFDSGCGLDRADWTATAEVYAVAGATVTLENFTFSGGTPTGFGFAHWFALGYIERVVAGVPERHLIFDSAAISSSRILFTLGAAPASAFTVGEDVEVSPGCDGEITTCSAYDNPDNLTGKFDNADQFGGFPLLPDKNPSFQPLKKTDSATGKK